MMVGGSLRWHRLVCCFGLLLSQAVVAQPQPDFNAVEKAWIARHPVVRIAIDPDWEPIEYRADHGAKGLSIAYLKKILDRAGLQFQYVETPSWEASIDALLDHQVDILPGVPDFQLPNKAAEKILISRPYYVGSTVIVTGAHSAGIFTGDELHGLTLALKRGGAYEAWMRHHYPMTKLLPLPNDREALIAVTQHRADAVIGMEAILRPLVHKISGDQDLHIAGVMKDLPVVLRMAVSTDEEILLSILNRALASLDVEEMDQISQSWLAEYDYGRPTLRTLIKYYQYYILGVLFLIGVLILLVYRARLEKRAAESTRKQKEMFLAVMSHEIRTPLNAIIASIELVEQHPHGERRQEFLHLAKDNSELLLALLNNIIDYTRFGSVTVQPTLVCCSLADICQTAASAVQSRIEAKGLNFVIDHGAEHQQLNLDPVLIKQILVNLLTNAAKFTETGTIELKTHSQMRSAEQDILLTFQVSDTGIGMSKEDLASLFRPFAQLNTPAKAAGSGLGLTICDAIAKAMQGTLRLESRLHEGTTATLTIPTTSCTLPSVTSSASARPISSVTQSDILVIEDTLANQKVLAAQLQMLGYTPYLAVTGEQGLAHFTSRRFAAVLLDFQLPDIAGNVVARHMRALEAKHGWPPTPLIVASASTSPEIVDQCLQDGVDNILAKPLGMDVLRETLYAWTATTATASAQTPVSKVPLPSAHEIIEEMQALHQRLSESVQCEDQTALKRELHRMKGIALIFNQAPLILTIEELESRAEKVPPDWRVIPAELERLLDTIHKMTF